MTITPADLGALGDQLGKGGEATVFDLPDLALPDAPGPLVYKRYRTPPESHGLRRVVASREALDDTGRARLDGLAAWPVRVVEEHGRAAGVVLPRIPAPFFDRVLRNSGVKHSLREVQNLFVAPDRALKVGRPAPDARQRLRVCLDFASGLAFLHEELKVVFGDLNAKNAVFRLDARPMVMFIDCDAVRPAGVVAVVRQLNAPDWDPPGAERDVLSRATDHYKLGLFVLRCLTPGPQGSTNRDPGRAAGVLDAEGLAMLRRALGTDPAARPTAREWEQRLRRLLGEATAPPRLVDVRLDRAFVLAGWPVEVAWEAEEAHEVEVVAAGRVSRVDGRPGRGSTPVVLDATGPVRVRVRNDLGADEREVGPVTVVPPPRFEPLTVPVPEVGWPSFTAPPPPTPGLPPLPVLDLRPGTRAPVPNGTRAVDPPALPVPRAMAFPLDLRAMLTGSPGIALWSRDGEGAGR
ncbi:protein kinase family protein [Saccharothrix syringae]|uniref:hypothetical protein n=1 Tax=Saccharothrix syringae TaxID=103733 RepID=UPI0005272516|nr:hypothetical protein [Saccharothrix syringae]